MHAFISVHLWFLSELRFHSCLLQLIMTRFVLIFEYRRTLNHRNHAVNGRAMACVCVVEINKCGKKNFIKRSLDSLCDMIGA